MKIVTWKSTVFFCVYFFKFFTFYYHTKIARIVWPAGEGIDMWELPLFVFHKIQMFDQRMLKKREGANVTVKYFQYTWVLKGLLVRDLTWQHWVLHRNWKHHTSLTPTFHPGIIDLPGLANNYGEKKTNCETSFHYHAMGVFTSQNLHNNFTHIHTLVKSVVVQTATKWHCVNFFRIPLTHS